MKVGDSAAPGTAGCKKDQQLLHPRTCRSGSRDCKDRDVAGDVAIMMVKFAVGEHGPGWPIEGDVCWVYGDVVLIMPINHSPKGVMCGGGVWAPPRRR